MSRSRDDGRAAMKAGLRQTVLALLVVLGLFATGCAKGTFLEVRFTGSGLPDIYGIRVELTLTPPTDDGGRSIGTVDPGRVIKLPTSMAFQLDSETGSLRVDAAALDMTGREVARASETTTIMRAKTWTLVMNLAPP